MSQAHSERTPGSTDATHSAALSAFFAASASAKACRACARMGGGVRFASNFRVDTSTAVRRLPTLTWTTHSSEIL